MKKSKYQVAANRDAFVWSIANGLNYVLPTLLGVSATGANPIPSFLGTETRPFQMSRFVPRTNVLFDPETETGRSLWFHRIRRTVPRVW